MNKIEEIESKMKEAIGCPKETKRLKNMISAYESRLLKRAKNEDLTEHLEIRNAQVTSIIRILKQELNQHQFLRIIRRIRTETPKMV